MYGAVQDQIRSTLQEIRDAGLYKRERELASPQSAQNVHSNEQMTAAPSGASTAPQRSHSVRISRLTAGPSRC